MQRRFVIQLHTAPGGRHFDLMLQHGPALATWRLERLPVALGPHDALIALALRDHRLAFLDYRGPLSAGRGSVQIADGGECRILVATPSLWIVELSGQQVNGRFQLRHLTGERWTLGIYH